MKYILFFLFASTAMATPHPDFVSIQDLCPSILIRLDYATKNNFTGSIVHGYKAKKAFLAKPTALALCKAQEHALSLGFSLKIFDSYRPVKAVEFFKAWAKLPETNPELKKLYYPTFDRAELFERGYIALKSSHSRGSAVDLTLVHSESGLDVDMGGAFDFLNELSATETSLITKAQQKNRFILRDIMLKEGFKNFAEEWWHYSLRPEPFPDEYFDFDIE